jgi:hypothetical protein
MSITRTRNTFSMEFNLSSIPSLTPSSLILSATLRFFEVNDSATPLSGTTNQHWLFAHAGNGTITMSDFNSPGTLVAQANNFAVETPKAFDVTSSISSLVTLDADFANFTVLYGSGISGGGFVLANDPYKIYGRLATNPELRPQLILTVVPEASPLLLVAMGLLGVVIFRAKTGGLTALRC